MPANIEGMVKQYSKIAIVKPNKNFNILSGKLTITENVNCSFTPKRAIAFLTCKAQYGSYYIGIDSNKGYHNQVLVGNIRDYETHRCKCDINNKNINIDFYTANPSAYDIPMILNEILLIG